MNEQNRSGQSGQDQSGQSKKNQGGEQYEKGKAGPGYEKAWPGQSASQEAVEEEEGRDQAGQPDNKPGPM